MPAAELMTVSSFLLEASVILVMLTIAFSSEVLAMTVSRVSMACSLPWTSLAEQSEKNCSQVKLISVSEMLEGLCEGLAVGESDGFCVGPKEGINVGDGVGLGEGGLLG